MLVTGPACFSPVPAVPALGVPSAEGGITEPKGGRDEPASHSSGSPRNHRRIPLHYPPPAPPYPALLHAGSRRSQVPAQGAVGSARVQGSASPLCSLRGFAWAWASFLTLWWVASAAGAVGASPPALFTGAPSPAFGCIRLHLAELCAYPGDCFSACLLLGIPHLLIP